MEPATQKPTDNPEYWNNALHVVPHASISMQTIMIVIRAYMSFPLLLTGHLTGCDDTEPLNLLTSASE